MDFCAALFALRKVLSFRKKIQSPLPPKGDGLELSLKQQSRPFRAQFWCGMLYPPGALAEVREPPSQWRVTVVV